MLAFTLEKGGSDKVNISQRIKKLVLETLESNKGGLSFNELHERLTRYHYKSLKRQYLGKTIGELFRSDKIQVYTVNKMKILQIKSKE